MTIASAGDATDFGDLTQATAEGTGTSNSVRAIIAGGNTPSNTNVIAFRTIAATGNYSDFGDLTAAVAALGSCSNGHGGLS